MPSEALQVFKKSTTLQYLDLSQNEISNIPEDVFSALSSSLTYLKTEDKCTGSSVAYIEWMNLLQNLHQISLKGSGDGDIVIDVNNSQLSLEYFEINEVHN